MNIQIYIKSSINKNEYSFYSENEFLLVPNIGDKISINITGENIFIVEDKIIYPSKVLIYCKFLH